MFDTGCDLISSPDNSSVMTVQAWGPPSSYFIWNNLDYGSINEAHRVRVSCYQIRDLCWRNLFPKCLKFHSVLHCFKKSLARRILQTLLRSIMIESNANMEKRACVCKLGKYDWCFYVSFFCVSSRHSREGSRAASLHNVSVSKKLTSQIIFQVLYIDGDDDYDDLSWSHLRCRGPSRTFTCLRPLTLHSFIDNRILLSRVIFDDHRLNVRKMW